MALSLGIKGQAEGLVVHENTAAAVGSGALEVFATPSMLALMEKCALESIQPYLAEGESSVGTHLDVSHLAATPLGHTVRAESELIEIDRRRLLFRVAAYDGDKLIGEGTHERFVVDSEKFIKKALG